MMNKIDIIHINHNSRGTEGLYEDGIYQSLSKKYKQELFVHSQFPFSYGNNLFFKFAYFTHLPQQSILFKVIKYIELCIDWFLIYLYIFFKRPKLVNHSLLSHFLYPERLFIRLVCRLDRVKVMLTCHDVIPFGENVENVINIRKPIINKVDYLLIHNEGSKNDLIMTYNVDPGKILQHSFPLMDMNKLFSNKTGKKDIDFVFIGYIRKEKGVHVLLKAWEKYHKTNKFAKLIIAGALADGFIDVEYYKHFNVDFLLYFLSPADYSELLNRSKYVVLPYLKGTNSGILYSALPAGCKIITSDIPMFKTDPIIKSGYMFKSGDDKDLLRVLNSIDINDNKIYGNCCCKYHEKIEEEMNSIYASIICSC